MLVLIMWMDGSMRTFHRESQPSSRSVRDAMAMTLRSLAVCIRVFMVSRGCMTAISTAAATPAAMKGCQCTASVPMEHRWSLERDEVANSGWGQCRHFMRMYVCVRPSSSLSCLLSMSHMMYLITLLFLLSRCSVLAPALNNDFISRFNSTCVIVLGPLSVISACY